MVTVLRLNVGVILIGLLGWWGIFTVIAMAMTIPVYNNKTLEIEVRRWVKNYTTSGYSEVSNITYLDRAFKNGSGIQTILASPEESYMLTCSANYKTRFQINFHPSRNDVIKLYRYVNGGDIFDSHSYRMITLFKFFTEREPNKNGSIVCSSVDNSQISAEVHFVIEASAVPDRSNSKEKGSNVPVITTPTSNNTTTENYSGTAYLYFSSEHAGAYCYDKKNKLSAKTDLIMISCSSPYSCDLYNNCFRDVQNCGARIQYGAVCETGECSFIQESYQSGMAQCKAGQNSMQEYFFTGFDKRRYTLSQQNIPKRALVYMDEIDAILFTDKPIFFFCAAVSFLFIQEIQFLVNYQNGTQARITKEIISDAIQKDVESRTTRETIDKGIYLNVTKEMTEVVCMVPWFNSSDWLTTSRKFTAKDVMLPFIKKSDETKSKWNSVRFYRGEVGRVLVCSANGQPPPKFAWFYNDQPLNNSLFMVHNTARESIVTFPNITHELGGKYRCVASNSYGSDFLGFQVEVQDSQSLSHRELSSSLIITFVIVGLIMFSTGLVLLWKKYQLTKIQRRNLTKSEVDEFEKGNPEALAKARNGNRKEINPTNIHLQPFNRNYVINPTDLILDENTVLGKGMFVVVIQGKLLGDTVAVKTTKPYTDVNYFKTLLSDIKMMTYIGKHKNVVDFIGAVTKHIQQKILFTSMEFSEYGDLKSFLKSHQSTFINLYDSPILIEDVLRDIGGGLLNTTKRVTTFDMLTWSYQIASGMNYLSAKQVIHADLAARNVLLFHGHVAKISDFGLSRKLYEHTSYVERHQAPLSWRWMAIESLRNLEFSTQSDIWSFGVTIWEIFSLGETPFPGITWDLDFINMLKDGLRMSKPEFSTAEIYDQVMLKCWNVEQTERPSFGYFEEYFNRLVNSFEQPDQRSKLCNN